MKDEQVAAAACEALGATTPTAELAQRIRQEFEEAPCLQLTIEEGARFWALDPATCTEVLVWLQHAGTVRPLRRSQSS